MFRLLAILIGVALLLGSGIVHGLWTDRWVPNEELEQAVARIGKLPADIGPWKGKEVEQDSDALQMAGAVAHYSRMFTEPETGAQVLVLVLAGKAGRMAVHRPEQCYQGAGYALSGQSLRFKITPPGEASSELWTGLFVRDEPEGQSQLRIFWSWCAAGQWQAPDNPRWSFARHKVLYKLYVIRSVAGTTPLPDDPSVRLLGELLPILNRVLSGE